jgi:hypothetical protein
MVRYDSLTGCVIAHSTNGGCFPYSSDRIIDSLSAKINNQSIGCNFSYYSIRICNDTSNITLFGIYQTKRKGFIHDGSLIGGATYARNFGLAGCNASELGDGTNYTLVGCVINGTVYGDTTLTHISNQSSKIPDKYFLYQNYPNPFNPTTIIKFEIPSDVKREMSNVRLIIFDITGREITTLVNEQLNPGTYEVTFDGSNLPSGIYFYKLTAGDFTDTKKLVLIK